MIASYSTDKPFAVYCHGCWFSDAWDPLTYGRDYDFSKPFFEQYKALLRDVPRMHLYNRNSTNSQYANGVVNSKNVYLSYSILFSEDISYSKSVDKSFRILDSINLQNSELCYENIDGENNHSSEYLVQSHANIACKYLYDSNGCTNCFMSSSIRNGEYVFRNQKCSKAEYEQKMSEIDFGSYHVRQELLKEFKDLCSRAIHKFSHITQAVDSSGNCLENSKHANYVFDGYDLENVKYAYRVFGMKDSMDVCYSGIKCELVYEYITGGTENYNIKFVNSGIQALQHVQYSDSCGSSSFLFGCAGLRSKQYCILNKQYSRDEYLAKIQSIKSQMTKDGEYGEFFPPELSPYAYNETVANEYFPLTKQEVYERGWAWKDPEERTYTVTKRARDLSDHIKDVSEEILKEVIGCEHEGTCNHACTMAFRIVPQELQFYKAMHLPLPRLCPNCRHFARLQWYPPFNLYDRSCMREGCANTFKTPYPPERADSSSVRAGAPDRPEIIYCESCYQHAIL